MLGRLNPFVNILNLLSDIEGIRRVDNNDIPLGPFPAIQDTFEYLHMGWEIPADEICRFGKRDT